jgi:thiol-disulfide isomerase/thioredoxin
MLLGAIPNRAQAAGLGGSSAAVILHRAEAKARAEHKNILLEFGASWCVNCKLYDRMLNDGAMRGILNKAFVFTEMDTGEQPGDKLHADTPGGVAFEDSVGGKNAGWPYLVVLNAEGKVIVSSMRPDAKAPGGRTNIGYPVLPVEIDWFMTMMRRGAPGLKPTDLAEMRGWLMAVAHGILHG